MTGVQTCALPISVDGDKILYLLARRLKDKGALDNNTVVATVMSNKGLLNALDKLNIKYECTSVGDRYVYERMQQMGYSLGGEQSGHVIIKKYATTGDGLLTALMVLEEMADKKSSLSKLVKSVKLYPQMQKNIPVQDKDAVVSDPDVTEAFERAKAELGERGRLMLRKSGTESVVRIMAECEDGELCRRYIKIISDAIKRKGYANAKDA